MLAHTSRRHPILWWILAITIMSLLIFFLVRPAHGDEAIPANLSATAGADEGLILTSSAHDQASLSR